MVWISLSHVPKVRTITLLFFLFLQANISQEEFFSKYNEYLSKVNYRKRRSAKFFGQDVTNYVYGDESESVKKIFTFKHSSE